MKYCHGTGLCVISLLFSYIIEEMTLVIKDVRGGLDPSFPLMSWYDAQSTDSPPSDRQLSIVSLHIHNYRCSV